MNLKIGQTFRNYNELCSFLNETPRTGGAKANHLKHLSLFFSYKIKKKTWIITQVFCPDNGQTSAIPPRKRKERTSFWQENLTLQILNDLSESLNSSLGDYTYNELIIPSSDGFKNYGFCNNYLFTINSMPLKELPEPLNTENLSFQEIVNLISEIPLITTAKFSTPNDILPLLKNKAWKDSNKTISRSCQTLMANKIIYYTYSYAVQKEEDPRLRSTTRQEELLIRTLTQELFLKFLPKEFEVLLKTPEEEFKQEQLNMQKICFSGNKDSFFMDRNEILKEKLGITLCKKAHILNFSPKSLAFGEKYKTSLTKILSCKQKVNGRCVSNVNSYLESRIINPYKKIQAQEYVYLAFQQDFSEELEDSMEFTYSEDGL